MDNRNQERESNALSPMLVLALKQGLGTRGLVRPSCRH